MIKKTDPNDMKCEKCKKDNKTLEMHKPFESKHPWLCEPCNKKYIKKVEKER